MELAQKALRVIDKNFEEAAQVGLKGKETNHNV